MSCETAKKVEELTGWKPPVTYDVSTDSFRIATQADLDALASLGRAYGQMRTLLKDAEKIHDQLMASLNKGGAL